MDKLFIKKLNSLIPRLILILVNLKKIYRKLIIILFDYLSIYLSLECLFYLIGYRSYLFFSYFAIIALPIYLLTKQFKPLTRFIESSSFYQILYRNFFIGILATIFCNLLYSDLLGFKYFIMFTILVFGMQSGIRIIIRDFIKILLTSKYSRNSVCRIAIYKADHLGVEFSNILKLDRDCIIEVFIDDNPTMSGCSINNIPIVSLKTFQKNKININKLIITSEQISFKELIKLKKFFKNLNVEVIEINPLKQLKNNNLSYDPLKNFSSKNIINRKNIYTSDKIEKEIISKKKSVCITGAGGSIGSELCRQFLSMNPNKLIIIDFCEYNLFKIFEELKELNNKNETLIVAKLLNAENQLKLEQVFKEENVEIVYHAAAYKHVPLVELNKIEGLRNNLLSTRSVSMAAMNNNISKVILISSDKAVRPSNIMGATKLFSEFLVKEISSLPNSKTLFSIVRFGNVIDSSGSVIPLFRNQIKAGGPLTITHPDMERYFMTISEAVNLVLEASVIMKGGETFILDMGKRIKIMELAKNMIRASGLELKDNKNKNGDIEIKIVGIRPGEKIIEELTFNGFLEKTKNPLIKIAKEKINIPVDFTTKINQVISCIENNQEKKAIEIFDILSKKILKK